MQDDKIAAAGRGEEEEKKRGGDYAEEEDMTLDLDRHEHECRQTDLLAILCFCEYSTCH
jgi:hypothetical protein